MNTREREVMDARRVFVDMDGVIVDFDGYKTAHGLTGDEVKARVGAYLDMQPIPGAIEAVRSLIGMGYEVWLATKPPTGIPHAYSDKAAWVMQHLPELKRRIVITHDKGMLGGPRDFLCDDRPHKANCEKFAGTLLRFIDGYHWPEALRDLRAARDALLAEGSASGEGAEAVAPFAQVHEIVATYTNPQPAQGEPVKDRDADRARFQDAAFNRWLDEGISDAGHTVYDSLGSVFDAWQGWQAREHYGPKATQGEHEQRSCEGSNYPEVQQARSWLAVVSVLNEVAPGWQYATIGTGCEKACAAIRALAQRCEGSERRPIADEVVSRACAAYTVALNAYGPQLQRRSAHEVAMRAALESALPRGLPAGSDALLDAGSKLYNAMTMQEYREEETFHIPQLSAQRVWNEAKAAWESALAAAEQPSCGQDALTDDERTWALIATAQKAGAIKDEDDVGSFWTLRVSDFAAIAAQQRQGGEK